MDQKELQEKIALFYSKLPPNVQEVFSSMKWLETLKTISQKYGLNQKQIETLGTETTLVLLGIIHLVEYEEALTNELGLSIDTADKILTEVEESIINTIRPQLIATFETNKNSESEDTPDIKTELDKRFETLPKETQNIIVKSNYQTTLYSVAKEYNLSVEQMGALEVAVVDLIVGTVPPDEFGNSLEKNLKLPTETTRKIVKDINEKIFLKIRELLKLINTPKGEEPALEGTEETKNVETKVLNSAGIEIIPDLSIQAEKLELGTTMNPTENREEMLTKIEKPETIHPILAQKLSGSFQAPSVTTTHSLDNISKSANVNISGTTKSSQVDPYREIPE